MADLNQVLTQVATTNATNQTGGQTQTGSMTQSQTPYYTPTQLGMQGQAQNLMQQILQGNLQQFGPTQATYDAANAMFQQRQAPKLAAMHGSGSPVLNSALQDLNLQLAGQFSQTAMPQALSAYNAAAQYAFNPTGFQNVGNQNQTTNQQMQTNQDQLQKNTDVGGILGTILNGLGGILGG